MEQNERDGLLYACWLLLHQVLLRASREDGTRAVIDLIDQALIILETYRVEFPSQKTVNDAARAFLTAEIERLEGTLDRPSEGPL